MTRQGLLGIRRRRPFGRHALTACGLLVLACVAVAAYHSFKPLPEGLSAAMPVREQGEVRFLADDTWVDASGQRRTEHHIFDRVLALIGGAERLIVLDMFLLNDFAGEADGDDMRSLSDEVTAALVDRKRARPEMSIILITDPINTLYGGVVNDNLERLERAGVDVVITRLGALRDPNPAWSGLWRICCQWLGDAPESGWLPNPVGDQAVPLRSLLAMLNFKANHRKTLVADTPGGWVGLVTSGNPHDASSAHGNVAVEFTGPAALDLLETERAVVRFSRPGLVWPEPPEPRPSGAERHDGTRIQVLTEAAILEQVLALLGRADSGDSIDLAMFYLSHRGVVGALKAAHRRGVQVRVLLDPNQGAFGRRKNGVPNQPVADELVAAGIPVRWCTTRGEQCHSKFMLYRSAVGSAAFIAGSANYTRRNLDDLNLETSVLVEGSRQTPVMRDAAVFFDRRWSNRGDRRYSLPYTEHGDAGRLRYWQYRITEATGLSTF
ncbi:phospholipase D family protein [Aquisalimonas lutea]|uniref:phospholipase D family protein n=1 Tax=Aquisalimonas lutea TaxID=1327750 RepID=UPI0025B37365|nr:phospholipase D family protein [Aquisalimonas lutea]MDN3517573.1 phospholipase D family protein [Aquisalimonas lutea]